MFTTSKEKLIQNLNEFSKNELVNYSFERNFDYGPPHNNVSKISPYLNKKFITEEEVVDIITKYNSIKTLNKFIEEIFWGTYWRGWLEAHPWIYDHYIKSRDDQKNLKKTGIKCFDYWKEELFETGYLHNHSRMWFASIWIFTLGYSWQSGAKLFEDNLLDYCPASNTLSWRWVAGLQTKNKPYIARADNIKFYTKNRFNPKDQINENIFSSFDFDETHNPLECKFSDYNDLKQKNDLCVILNNNDLSLNKVLEEIKLDYRCVLFKSPQKNKLKNKFQSQIYNDICSRNREIIIIESFQQMLEWLRINKIKNILFPYETVGKKLFNDPQFLNQLKSLKISYLFYLRKWDRNAFPFATKNFFKFKKHIPDLLKIANIRDKNLEN